MAKQIDLLEPYIRVELRDPGDYGCIRMGGQTRTAEENKRDAATLLRAITTRLSKMNDEFGHAYVVQDKKATCDSCGATWTEVSDLYNGGCCDEDEENNPSNAEDPSNA